MRTGENGLPYMGTGDWNDGMDELGAKGLSLIHIFIPALLSSKKRVGDVCAQLERHYLSNRCENAVYVLLGDYKDAPNQTEEQDAGIYAEGVRLIEGLNKKYPQAQFVYLHRARSYVRRDKKYMGYERDVYKRQI